MKTFRVVNISPNRNAYGLNQVIFLSTGEDREAFKACIWLLSPPENAQKYALGSTHQFDMRDFPFNLPHMELPVLLPPPPEEVWREFHAPYS